MSYKNRIPNIWWLRDVSAPVEPKNVAFPSFAQRFRVSGVKKSRAKATGNLKPARFLLISGSSAMFRTPSNRKTLHFHLLRNVSACRKLKKVAQRRLET
jgi:hypothetical protein